MSEAAGDPLRDASREELMSALFAHVVMQNTNMALMFLGKAPNPQTGERMHDMEAAKLFIDQLEMLEVKTKGNLSREEEKLLQQSLMHLRMTFVQVVENPPKTEPIKPEPSAPETSAGQKPAESKDSGESEPQKRFSKKF
jgi:hypothetical protein